LARPLVERVGQMPAIVAAGTLRVGWPIGLALVPPGTAGLLLVIGLELGLVTSCALFNPIVATYRLEHAAPDRIARTLSAWSITPSVCIAGATGLWGVLAELVGVRAAIAAAGVVALPTPLLLVRSARARDAACGVYGGGRCEGLRRGLERSGDEGLGR